MSWSSRQDGLERQPLIPGLSATSFPRRDRTPTQRRGASIRANANVRESSSQQHSRTLNIRCLTFNVDVRSPPSLAALRAMVGLVDVEPSSSNSWNPKSCLYEQREGDAHDLLVVALQEVDSKWHNYAKDLILGEDPWTQVLSDLVATVGYLRTARIRVRLY